MFFMSIEGKLVYEREGKKYFLNRMGKSLKV